MKLLLFRTDIGNKTKLRRIKPVFQQKEFIAQWYIDLEDCDNVLKIVADGPLSETEVISLLEEKGFMCEVLPD